MIYQPFGKKSIVPQKPKPTVDAKSKASKKPAAAATDGIDSASQVSVATPRSRVSAHGSRCGESVSYYSGATIQTSVSTKEKLASLE